MPKLTDEEAQRKAVALFNELKDRVSFVDMHFMQSVGSSGLGEHVVIGLEVRCAGERWKTCFLGRLRSLVDRI